MPRCKMKPGFVLGIEDNVGDAFTYQIIPEDKFKSGKRFFLKQKTKLKIIN